MPIEWILAAPLVVAGLLLMQPWLRERRREKLRSLPFPGAWREILLRRVPHYRLLPAPLRARLERHIRVFLDDSTFSGCAGQAIDDEVRLTISAQACLLLLGNERSCFPKLRSVLVYPGAFLVERLRPEPSGVVQEHRQVLSGESWSQGQVVLSWEDTLAGAAMPHDGRNVVIHEFAHQVDQQKGYANGAPGLPSRARRERWARAMADEYARLQRDVACGEPTLFDAYGATAPEEFFAVASEVFFERPGDLAARHPAAYRELRDLYGVDPVQWLPLPAGTPP